MLNLITTVLELVGALLLLAALALAGYVLVPQPFSLAACLAIAGGGLIGLSFILAPLGRRGRRGTR